MENKNLKLTATQLASASVGGKPGDVNYPSWGPNWAKIAVKRHQLADLQARCVKLETEHGHLRECSCHAFWNCRQA
jgi:hypothetical protein